jgi:hypothetical protein
MVGCGVRAAVDASVNVQSRAAFDSLDSVNRAFGCFPTRIANRHRSSDQEQCEKHDEETGDNCQNEIYVRATGKIEPRDSQEPRDRAQRDLHKREANTRRFQEATSI